MGASIGGEGMGKNRKRRKQRQFEELDYYEDYDDILKARNKYIEEVDQDLIGVSIPLIMFIRRNFNPHTKVVVGCDTVEVIESTMQDILDDDWSDGTLTQY